MYKFHTKEAKRIVLEKNNPFTPRQKQIVQDLCDGLTLDEIAAKRKIAKKTVRQHLHGNTHGVRDNARFGVSGRLRRKPKTCGIPYGLLREGYAKLK